MEIDIKVRNGTHQERLQPYHELAGEFEIEPIHPFWSRGNRAWALTGDAAIHSEESMVNPARTARLRATRTTNSTRELQSIVHG